MRDSTANTFRPYFSQFLERLFSLETLVRFSIPVVVFLGASILYPFGQQFYGIKDSTFLPLVLIFGGGLSFLLMGVADTFPLGKTKEKEAVSSTQNSHFRADWKRFFDILLSVCCLILEAPLFVLIGIAIKLADGGPIFHVQDRLGKGGRVFRIFKFRSYPLTTVTKESPTRLGLLLRATALDELPIVLNILKGDMSFVGPMAREASRAEAGSSAEPGHLRKVPGYEELRQMRPGLTGLAQVYAPRGITEEQRVHFDIVYVKNRSLWLDLSLMVLSFWICLRGKWETRSGKEYEALRKEFQQQTTRGHL